MLKCRVFAVCLSLCITNLFASELCFARSHYLISGFGGGWQVSSFRSVDESPTQNQYSYHGQFTAGYSFDRNYDAKLLFSYRPLNQSGATLESAESQQLVYGAELGGRFVRGVYAGLRLCDSQLKIRKPRNSDEYGIWTGLVGGLILGGYLDINNDSKVMLAVAVETSQLRRDSFSSRPWDSYQIQVSYDFFDRLK